MSWAINERLDVERQLVRAICYDVARGVSPPGDAMPSPQALAQERVLNPRVAESAYGKLVEAGVLCVGPAGDYQTTEHAPRLARDCLLRWAEEEMKDLAGALRRAGLSTEDVKRVFREVSDA